MIDDIEINWAFLISFVSLLFAVFAYISNRLNKIDTTKKLRIRSSDNSTMLGVPDFLKDRIKLSYNNKEIEQLNVLTIAIQNHSSVVINKEDFNQNFLIKVSGFNSIMEAFSYQTEKHTKIEKISTNDEFIELQVDNFNSNEYLKIEIYYDTLENEVAPTLTYCLKNKKEEEIELNNYSIVERNYGASKDYNNIGFLGLIMILSLSYSLLFLVFKYGLGLDIDFEPNFQGHFKILIVVLSILITVYYMRKIFKWLGNYHDWEENVTWISNKKI